MLRDLVTELKEQLHDTMKSKKTVKVEKNVYTQVEALESDQEETDSRMFVHTDHAVAERN